MIFLFLLPGYLLINIYVGYRLLRWLGSVSPVLKKPGFVVPVSLCFALLVYSPLLALILPKSAVAILIRRLSAYWMGIILYSLLAIITAEALRFIAMRTRLKSSRIFTRAGAITAGLGVIAATALCCVIGSVHARDIKLTKYEVTVDKQVEGTDEFKIVLIADTHMGYAIGRDHIKKTVDMINSCDADLVVFAGDIFDNSLDGLDYPEEIKEQFRRIESRYGVWAVYGNHDINEKILMGFTFGYDEHPAPDEEMSRFVSDCGINILTDESVLIDGKFYLVGRRDGEKPGTEDGSRVSPYTLTKGLDMTKPIFFIAHEPNELEETAEAGADIDFSGHTHDGQTFPGNIVTDLVWENSCGMIEKGKMRSIVTSGVGVFGPFMRLGTDAEICEVTVKFNR